MFLLTISYFSKILQIVFNIYKKITYIVIILILRPFNIILRVTYGDIEKVAELLMIILKILPWFQCRYIKSHKKKYIDNFREIMNY